MKTVNDIKIIEGVAKLEGVSNENEIKLLYNFVKQNNVEKYVAVSNTNKKYFYTDEGYKLLPEGEAYALNPNYVAPVVETIVEEPEVIVALEETNVDSKETSKPSIAYFNNRIWDLEKQLEAAETKVKELENACVAHTTELETLKYNNSVLESELVALRKISDNQDEKIKNLNNDKEVLYNELDDARTITINDVVEYVQTHPGLKLIIGSEPSETEE